MRAVITQAAVAIDGTTHVSFEIRDESDNVVATHSQGFASERERLPETCTRTVPQRAEDGSGDVVRGDDKQPVMLEEEYEEMVETGRVLPASAETIREGIRNYVRDVLPLRSVDPPVAVGDAFSIEE